MHQSLPTCLLTCLPAQSDFNALPNIAGRCNAATTLASGRACGSPLYGVSSDNGSDDDGGATDDADTCWLLSV